MTPSSGVILVFWADGLTDFGLALLEPMAGIGFALGLAYLNLQRFRYREEIRLFAKNSNEQFKSQGIRQGGETQSGYGRIQRYAALNNNDPTDPTPKKSSAKLGKGVWCWIYGHLFEFHNDRDFVGLFTFLAAVTIVLGVASTSFENLASLKTATAQNAFFWIVLLSMSIPPLFVWIGGRVVADAKSQIDEDTKDVLRPMVDDAQTARAPSFTLPQSRLRQPNPVPTSPR